MKTATKKRRPAVLAPAAAVPPFYTGSATPCDNAQQFLLDTGWDEDFRAAAMVALLHVKSCSGCRAALADYDAIRAACMPMGEMQVPKGGWRAMEARAVKFIRGRIMTQRRRAKK